MNYQVLARKWRPKRFSDVVGQHYVLAALINGLRNKQLHHGYLFSGIRGIGKTTIARIFIKGLNCETSITATPCCECINCIEIEQGCFIDSIEVDAASRTKVEDIRDLLDNVQYLPTKGRFKVYLIDEVHMLSRYSFNALLKTLEEPPEHIKFLFATTDIQKLPVTILSRCLKLNLKVLNIPQINAKLELILNTENIKYDKNAIYLIASVSEGSLRDALNLTDQAIMIGQGRITYENVSQMLGILDEDKSLSIIESLICADSLTVMEIIEQIVYSGFDLENLLVDVLSRLHSIAMIQLLPTKQESELISIDNRLKKIAKNISPENLQLFYQILLAGRKELAYAPEKRMGVEMIFLRALAFHPKFIVDEI
ncbi:DNA polymerase III subunit tau, gamma isoform [Candidatus Providencia siddallii]|uniref:DNA polymerase III subunit gamma/tau n=1 Tax=Candidatus Providencia siddallii TaxID=1715285 RepID=A0A0M6W7Q3_9GAMM|nr:DNA polymerase III subunit tau, gamma isoform [Candidatus Providencia siddallii]